MKARDHGRRDTPGDEVLKKRRSFTTRTRSYGDQCDTRARLTIRAEAFLDVAEHPKPTGILSRHALRLHLEETLRALDPRLRGRLRELLQRANLPGFPVEQISE